MADYRKRKIKDLCSIQRIHVVPREGTTYTLFSLPAFDNAKTPEIVDGQAIMSGKLVLTPQTILYNKLNVKFKRVWNIKGLDKINTICSPEYIPLKVNNGVDQDYIYYHLISNELTQTMHGARKGTSCSQQRIDADALLNYEIPVPTIEEQKKIASILLKLDERIENNNAINNNLQQQAISLYQNTFPYSIDDKLPDGWRVATVGEIIDLHDSKQIPLSGGERDKMKKKIYPYYGATSLMDYVDDYIFDGIYLLLGEDGTVIDVNGYPVLQYVWGKFWVNNHAHIITGKLGFSVESLWVLFKLTSVRSIVTGAVQPKISQANLRSIRVALPPNEKLKAYNECIQPMFSTIRNNFDENKRLSTLRDLLLPKLMNGEIDVSDVEI